MAVGLAAVAVVAPAGCGADRGVCTGATALSAFGDTAAILKSDGSLWTWTQYQNSIVPKLAQRDAGATGFANGQMCLRLRSGDVSCPYLLLSGALPPHPQEVSVWFEGGLPYVGDLQPLACAVLLDGTLLCVGQQGPPLTQIGTGIKKVSAGWDHYCAITTEAKLVCQQWADTAFIGPGQTGASWSTAGPTLSNVVEVVTASDVAEGSVARDADGNVWWMREESPTPEQVTGIDGPVVQLIAGPSYFCALRDDGAVFCWNDSPPPDHIITPDGVARNVPTQITSLPRPATALAGGPGEGGGEFACALLEDTTVWCWGAGFGGPSGQHVAACD